MQLGIFAKTFLEVGAENVLNAVKQNGFACTQFNMACVGLPSLPDEIPISLIDEISKARKSSGVAIIAISATYNMIHPDMQKRKEGLKKLEVIMKAASALNVDLVTLCTGSCDPSDQWRQHPDNQSEQSWKNLRREMEAAIELAQKYKVRLGIEPELANVVNSAKAARRLLDESKSEWIKIILDPVNLFEPHEAAQQNRIVENAMGLLQDSIAMAHAKDRDTEGRIVAAGRGVVDFANFIKRLKHASFTGPLITHGLHANETSAVAQHLKQLISQE
jgi:sugar phosphate isomerase/epimerase